MLEPFSRRKDESKKKKAPQKGGVNMCFHPTFRGHHSTNMHTGAHDDSWEGCTGHNNQL